MRNAHTRIRRRKFSGQVPASEAQHKESSSTRRVGYEPNLKVGPTNDRYEKEADAMAAKVVRGESVGGPKATPMPGVQRMAEEEPAARPLVQRMEEEEPVAKPLVQRMEEEEPAAKPLVQRAEEEEESPMGKPLVQRMEEEEPAAKPLVQRAEEEEPAAKPLVQRMEEEEPAAKPMAQRQAQAPGQGHGKAMNSGVVPSRWTESKISQRKGSGQPLPKGTRQFMESRFGADFSKVRIHNDQEAHKLSKNLNAQAFTVGHDVYFNRGYFNPETHTGKELLAHELTHTLQQKGWVQRQEHNGGDKDKKHNASAGVSSDNTVTLDKGKIKPAVSLFVKDKFKLMGHRMPIGGSVYFLPSGAVKAKFKFGGVDSPIFGLGGSFTLFDAEINKKLNLSILQPEIMMNMPMNLGSQINSELMIGGNLVSLDWKVAKWQGSAIKLNFSTGFYGKHTDYADPLMKDKTTPVWTFSLGASFTFPNPW